MNLQGKRALITGGTRGIGAAVAIDFAKHGADVVINSRGEDEEAKATLAELESIGVSAELVAADVSDPAECERLVNDTVQRFGGLDVLVHSAGGPAPGTVEVVTPDDWRAAFDVHVHALYELTRHALPHLRKNGEGAIIVVSSVAGIRG
ncbi:MAG: SDR family NAD(P)-dependent oxidoreductase, partial [Planctomycetota bacterium]